MATNLGQADYYFFQESFVLTCIQKYTKTRILHRYYIVVNNHSVSSIFYFHLFSLCQFDLPWVCDITQKLLLEWHDLFFCPMTCFYKVYKEASFREIQFCFVLFSLIPCSFVFINHQFPLGRTFIIL